MTRAAAGGSPNGTSVASAQAHNASSRLAARRARGLDDFRARRATIAHARSDCGSESARVVVCHDCWSSGGAACDRPVAALASVDDQERMASAGCGRSRGGVRGGSGLVQERTVVGVEDPPAEESQDVVPDRRRQVSGVVAAVGLGADPVGSGSAPGFERRDGPVPSPRLGPCSARSRARRRRSARRAHAPSGRVRPPRSSRRGCRLRRPAPRAALRRGPRIPRTGRRAALARLARACRGLGVRRRRNSSRRGRRR